MAAAVAMWTVDGKTVRYAMATYGEAGIEGMSPAETAAVREAEQRRAAEIVGVADVEFWDLPDSELRYVDELRAVCTNRRSFANGPNGTHAETVDDFVDAAVNSLAAHAKYLPSSEAGR
jgi:LmbE family N-acetylglucosaminyl deacetylase